VKEIKCPTNFLKEVGVVDAKAWLCSSENSKCVKMSQINNKFKLKSFKTEYAHLFGLIPLLFWGILQILE